LSVERDIERVLSRQPIAGRKQQDRRKMRRKIEVVEVTRQPAVFRILRPMAVKACARATLTMVRSWGGPDIDQTTDRIASNANDPMYGPAVRCKRISSIWQRSCINVSGL
jgi:hypothetical protein